MAEGGRALEDSIVSVLRESPNPLKALNIARKISPHCTRKDVNRVLTNVLENRKAEKANPGQNPPLWRLIQSPSNTGASPSPGALGGFTPSPSSATTTRRASTGIDSSGGGEIYSKTVGDDGTIEFKPVHSNESAYSSLQTSPEEVPAPPQQVSYKSGISETGAANPSPVLQAIDNTALGAVASSLDQSQKPKKKVKRRIAASFGQESSSEGDRRRGSVSQSGENFEPPSTELFGQETDSPKDAYVGQEMDRADQDRFTQERSQRLEDEMSDEMSSVRIS